jgi:phosphate transport system substrate-binding protein
MNRILTMILSILMFYSVSLKEKAYGFPVIDGSTSTIKLDEAIGTHFDPKGNHRNVSHSKTFESLQKLIAGECDIVFSVPLSKEQQATVIDTDDFELVSVPIALEGFVFIVNPENPINALSQAQIRDIYSGKITNWSDLGGDDAEIIAYQRNIDSGSQTYMTEFMGETQLAAAPLERVPGSMGAMMTNISSYDNSKYAIGYSVYSYAAQVMEESGNISFVAVDGVEPSGESFTDGSYPLMSYTYAFYNKNNPNPKIEKLINDILSEEGQRIIADAGYYPVKHFENNKADIYYTLGTGREKPTDLQPSRVYTYYETNELNILKDNILQEKIKKWVSENTNNASKYRIINGYLSYGGAAVWDLYSGEKLEFSDLFYKDVDFLPALNKYIGSHAYSMIDGGFGRLEFEFLGMLSEPISFSVTAFRLDDYYDDNAVPTYPMFTEQDDSLIDLMPAYEYRDMRGILTVTPEERNLPLYTEDGFYKDGNYYFQVQSRYENVSELNADLLKICENFYAHIKAGDFPKLDTTSNLNTYWDINIHDTAIGFSDYGYGVYFDRETHELISMEDFFDISKANFYDNFSSPIDKYDYSKIYTFWWNVRNNGIVDTDYFDITVSGIKKKYKDFVLNMHGEIVYTYYN